MKKLITISDLSKLLNLVDNNKKPLNYVLRYWEKEFNEIKSKKIKNRRYYTFEQVETIKLIKFLLKNKGMTINGVKKILNNQGNNETLNLDEISNNSIRTNNFKNKVLKISKIVKNLKNYK